MHTRSEAVARAREPGSSRPEPPRRAASDAPLRSTICHRACAGHRWGTPPLPLRRWKGGHEWRESAWTPGWAGLTAGCRALGGASPGGDSLVPPRSVVAHLRTRDVDVASGAVASRTGGVSPPVLAVDRGMPRCTHPGGDGSRYRTGGKSSSGAQPRASTIWRVSGRTSARVHSGCPRCGPAHTGSCPAPRGSTCSGAFSVGWRTRRMSCGPSPRLSRNARPVALATPGPELRLPRTLKSRPPPCPAR